MTANPHKLALEPAAQDLVEATDTPPYLPDLGPQKGREVVNDLQKEKSTIAVEEEWTTIGAGAAGSVKVRIVRPPAVPGPLPVVVYIHGAGWVFGNADTHDRLVRELATQSRAAVVFPDYSLSPEAKYPTALEQCYAAAKWVAEKGADFHLDGSRIGVAGDSVGGNMSIAITLLALQRNDFQVRQLVGFYPVTDAAFDTESYRLFGQGYFLRRQAMQWFWDQYISDPGQRAEITASPLRAGSDQLAGFPPTLIITAEADVLRDEGEAFAAKLRSAGVAVTAVRYGGIVHDFVMLNSLKDTNAAKSATAQAAAALRSAFE